MSIQENIQTKKYTFTSDERKRARAAVGKWLQYFEDKRTSSPTLSEENHLLTRRRNLAAHLGVDESVSKKDLALINVYSLPLPPSKTVGQPSSTNLRSPKRPNVLTDINDSELSSKKHDTGYETISIKDKNLRSHEVEASQPCGECHEQLDSNTAADDLNSYLAGNSIYFSCCERHPCDEKTVVLNRCPKEVVSSSLSTQLNEKKENKNDSLRDSSIKVLEEYVTTESEESDESETPTCSTSDLSMFNEVYTCCNDDRCKKEDIVILDMCPNSRKSSFNPELYPVIDEKEYKIKDLTNFLGMKDGVRCSSVTVDEPTLIKKFSRSLKRNKIEKEDLFEKVLE